MTASTLTGTPDGLTVTARPDDRMGFPFRAECTSPSCCGPHANAMVWLASSHDELTDRIYPRYQQHLRDMAQHAN